MKANRASRFHWDDVRAFLAVADHGSISGAARELRVTHATVARRVEDLERTLGGPPLFERSRVGYTLTGSGQAALAEARTMAAAAEGFGRAASGADDMAGLVRISATATVADRVVASALAALAVDHPKLEIEIESQDRNVSLARREVDVAVRLGRPTRGDAIARRIGTIRYRLFGTPGYLESTPPDGRRVFPFSQPAADAPLPRALAGLARGREARVRLPSFAAQAAAAMTGSGMAMLPDFLRPEIDLLVPAEDAAWEQEVWMITHRDAQRFRSVQAVIAAIVEAFAPTLKKRAPEVP